MYKLSYGRTFNLGSYESERIDIERDFEDEVDPEDAISHMKYLVNQLHQVDARSCEHTNCMTTSDGKTFCLRCGAVFTPETDLPGELPCAQEPRREASSPARRGEGHGARLYERQRYMYPALEEAGYECWQLTDSVGALYEITREGTVVTRGVAASIFDEFQAARERVERDEDALGPDPELGW